MAIQGHPKILQGIEISNCAQERHDGVPLAEGGQLYIHLGIGQQIHEAEVSRTIWTPWWTPPVTLTNVRYTYSDQM